MSSALLERYDDRIAGVLSCYDRVVITGTLPTVCYADGMTKFLNAAHVRIFDYPRFAEPLRERVRERAAALAAEAGLTIEHIGKKHVRKEAVVAKVLRDAASIPGWCISSRRWRDATLTSRGTTSRPTGPTCALTAASACTTTSTSWMPSWA
jgi:hypothetical protein